MLRISLTCFLWCVSLVVAAAPTDVVINEIMYNPPDDGTGEELEYVELYNKGAEDVDLSGWQFADGIDFTFPSGTIIESGGFLVVCSDPTEMVSTYGIYNIIGPFDGRLNNQGERVALSDNSAVPALIDEVDYETGGEWPGEPDGNGPSLELVNPWVDNNVGGHWRASEPPEDNGTPGVQNSCYQGNPPPVTTSVSRFPISPDATQNVTITATVHDDTAVQAVHLSFIIGDDPGGEAITLEMNDLGDSTYSATIPPHGDGTWVWYTIEASDDEGAVGGWPIGAPANKAWYRVENIPGAEGDIVINEIMYNNTEKRGTDLEWVEIFNAGSRTTDLSLWCLKDDEDAHSFYLPLGTSLAPGDFLVICHDAARTEQVYGITNVVGDFAFRLSDGGSQVRLFNANGLLMDWVEYEDSSPWSELADGQGASIECVNPSEDNSLFNNWGPGLPAGTPGAVNSIYSTESSYVDIVINEIMYHPANDDDDEQFIELLNRGSQTVDLSGWQLTRGITHEFIAGTTIPGGGFLVLCKNRSQVQKMYHFSAPAIRWDMGRLDHGGETLALENAVGTTVDIVRYNDVPPWPVAADGFGSSLECINPFVDNNHPRNWRASSGSTYWQCVQRTGTATSSRLYIYMLEPGECLIDDVSITDIEGTDNYIPNGDFETDEAGWQKSGNHSGSYREIGQAHSGNACMHVVSTGTGGSSSNSVSIFTAPDLVQGQTYVLSFWVKHVKGGTTLYSRLSGGGIGGETTLAGSGLLSSPGVPNSSFSLDLPPFISAVGHLPAMPEPDEVGRIVAAVEDDVQVTLVMLEYKSALEDTWTSVEMHDDGLNGDEVAGDGLYYAMTTAYPSETVVQYIVGARDNAGNTAQSPAENEPKPNHAYFVYNREVVSKLPVYFMTIPNMAAISPWSDNYHPATFVYQGKVYENVGVRYRGGTARSYPKKCLKVRFNRGDLFTGTVGNSRKSINLQALWADKSYLREKLAYDMFKKMGVPYCETRHVLLHINGSYWGLFLEMEAPGRRYLKRNGQDDSGNLYKAAFSGSGGTGTSANGFEKKTNETDGSKADLESFLWGINNTPLEEITDFLNTHTIVDSHMAYNAVGCVIGSADQPHKNYFVYHEPTSDKWEMFPWDMDLTYGRNYYPGHGVCNDIIRWDSHIFLCSRIHPNYDGFWNRIIDRFFYPENSLYTEPFRTKMAETTKYILDCFFTTKLQYEEIDLLVGLIREEA
ncbi:lamin tail domain-containing protein, partial [bacterium]|nr:lamin tail domain-containing protein [bacterium]